MARTSIDINSTLIAKAMTRYQLHSKREAVDFALRRLLEDSLDAEDQLAMEGTGWNGDLDETRPSRVS